MAITVSPLTIEGYEEVIKLWRQCEGVGLSSTDSKGNIHSFLEKNTGTNFIAKIDNRLVGTVLAGHDGRRGYIYHLAVHPDWRRQGLGRKLVDRCLTALREAGIQKCHLFVFTDNVSGLDFWKALGWEKRSDLFVMSKTLEVSKKGSVSKKHSATTSDQVGLLTDRNFIIRPMTAPDWPVVRSIFEEGIATGNATFETEAPTWEKWDSDHLKECRLVAVDSGRTIGWAALSPVSSRCVYAGVAEVSLYIAAGEQGRGIGKQLLQALVQESEQSGIWTLQAGIFPENMPSIALHRLCGFRMIGRREKLGKMNDWWRDVLLFERRSTFAGIG